MIDSKTLDITYLGRPYCEGSDKQGAAFGSLDYWFLGLPFSPQFSPPMTVTMKRYDGANWVATERRVRGASSWNTYNQKMWNGSNWVAVT